MGKGAYGGLGDVWVHLRTCGWLVVRYGADPGRGITCAGGWGGRIFWTVSLLRSGRVTNGGGAFLNKGFGRIGPLKGVVTASLVEWR